MAITVRVLSGDGANGAIVSALAVGCLLRETQAPNHIKGTIEEATGRDGRQEASWGGLTMSYAVNEDTGLTAVWTAE